VTPQQALLLAAHNSQTVNSIAATIGVQGTTSSGAMNIAGTFTEQVHPSLIVDANLETLSVAGQSVPGGMAEVATQSAIYIKSSAITQALNASKQWVEFPLASMGATGSALSSLLSQAQGESPVTQTELLAHSKTVHKVGTGVIDGVAVTEYAGTYTTSQALATLPASARSSISKQISESGIKDAQFEIWLDSQQHPRKIVIHETGTAVTETITETITSFNQPVSIKVPTAAETYVIPASALGSLAG
jgi:hypothetical protein